MCSFFEQFDWFCWFFFILLVFLVFSSIFIYILWCLFQCFHRVITQALTSLVVIWSLSGVPLLSSWQLLNARRSGAFGLTEGCLTTNDPDLLPCLAVECRFGVADTNISGSWYSVSKAIRPVVTQTFQFTVELSIFKYLQFFVNINMTNCKLHCPSQKVKVIIIYMSYHFTQ